MKIIYEKGDRVVELETGVHHTVHHAATQVHRNRIPITSTQLVHLEGQEHRILPEEAVRPVIHALVLNAVMGQVHGVMLVPDERMVGFSASGIKHLDELAEFYNQSVERDAEVVWCDNVEACRRFIREKNGDDEDGEEQGEKETT